MIAVMAQKLQLSRSEEYVHNFITENKLKKRVFILLLKSKRFNFFILFQKLKLKNLSANVIRETWLVYKFRKLRPDPSQCRTHQRKLLKSIDE